MSLQADRREGKAESSKSPRGRGELVTDPAPRVRVENRGTRTVRKSDAMRAVEQLGVLDGLGLSSKARSVFHDLLGRGDAPELLDSGELVVRNIFPTKATIARRLGVSVRTVDRAVDELALAGLLAWKTVPPKRNLYMLTLPPEVAADLFPDADASTGQGDAEPGQDDASTRHAVVSMRQSDASKYQTPQPETTTNPPHQTHARGNAGGGGGVALALEVEALLVGAGVSSGKAREIATTGSVTPEVVRQLVDASKAKDKGNPAGWLAWACGNTEQALAMIRTGQGVAKPPTMLDRMRELAAQPNPAETTEQRAAKLEQARQLSARIEPILGDMTDRERTDLVIHTARAMTKSGQRCDWFVRLDKADIGLDKALTVDPREQGNKALALRAAMAKHCGTWSGSEKYKLATA